MDDFQFGPSQNTHFQSSEGVGSRVTEREGMRGGDKSVTVSQSEKKLLLAFHNQFPRMSIERARARGENTEFEFRLYPNGSNVSLAINHPKSEGDETRIYFRRGIFYPRPGDFWFIFERGGQLWIGSLDEKNFDLTKRRASVDFQNGFDHLNEDSYQSVLNGKDPLLVTTTSVGYRRDPKVAKDALEKFGFVCELLPMHEVFTSKSTGNPYLEGHHFLPMFEQRHIPEVSIDVVDNICILNPYAHKMLHHATYGEIKAHLKKLAEPREEFLKTLDLNVDDVLRIYGGP